MGAHEGDVMSLIAPRLCGYCREPFTPLRPKQTYCRVRCARLRQGERLRGRRPIEAIAARRAQAETRSRAVIETLTDPIAIYQRGRRDGYTEGYNRAYYEMRQI